MQAPPDGGAPVPSVFGTNGTWLRRNMPKRTVSCGDMWACSPCGWILELGVWGHVGVARDEPRSLTLPAGIFDRFCARKYIFWVIDMTSPCAWILGLGVWGHVGVARDEPGGLTLPAGIFARFCARKYIFWVRAMISHGGVRGLHWDLGVSTWAGRCHLACRSVSP